MNELKIKYFWKGKGFSSKCYIKKNKKIIVQCHKSYFRPLEVDTLLGSPKKAKKILNWKPKYNINSLVREMVREELNFLSND